MSDTEKVLFLRIEMTWSPCLKRKTLSRTPIWPQFFQPIFYKEDNRVGLFGILKFQDIRQQKRVPV